jgi:hypothetical protein
MRGRSGQNSQDEKKNVGMVEHDNMDTAEGTEQLWKDTHDKDRQERTAGTGEDSQDRTSCAGQPGQVCLDRSAWTKDRLAGTRTGQENRGRTAGLGQPNIWNT